MAGKKRKPLNFAEVIRLIKRAGLPEGNILKAGEIKDMPLEDFNQRIRQVLNIYNTGKKTNEMIFFIMYDIEHNKVRTHIAKYLLSKGCIRLQKSVFIAQKPRAIFDELYSTLKEVQDMYDNEDSILLLPVSTDEMHAMKLIGKNISFDVVMDNKNVIIF